jgi:hypothetical protein
MAISQNFPSEGPNLYVNFAGSKTLDPRINFSRASTGTYVDADGLIKTAAINRPRFDHNILTGESLGLLVEPGRTNLLRQSIVRPDLPGDTYSFWTSFIGGTTIRPYAELSPDGTFNAALVQNSTASIGDMLLRYEQSLAGVSGLVDSIWVKAVSGTVTVAMYGSPTAQDTVTNVTFGTQWTRLSMRRPSSANYFLKLIKISATPVSFYVWGGQCESGTFSTSFIPTLPTFTSRASSATFYDSTGILRTAATNVARSNAFFPDSSGVFRSGGLLLESAATNLCIRSETFTAAPWTDFTANVSITANQLDPAGGTTASLVTHTAGTSRHRVSEKISTTRVSRSFYVKKTNQRYIYVGDQNASNYSPNYRFDLDTGTGAVIADSFGYNYGYSITKVANEFYRIWVDCVSQDITQIVASNTLSSSGTNPLSTNETATGTESFIIWGYQVETGTYFTSYIQTTGATATRAADVTTSSAVTRSADIVSLSGTSSIVNTSGGTLLSLSNQTSPVIDTTSLSINSTSLSTSRPVREILYYPTVLTSTTIKQIKAFPSFVTNGLQLHLDAGNTSSYSGSGSTWTDLSGNGRNFTLVNSSYYAFDSANEGSIRLTRTLPPTAETGGYAEHTGSGALAVTTYLYNNHTTEIWARINDRNPTNHTVNETQSALFVYRGWHSMFYYGSSALTYTVYDGASTARDAVGLSIGTSGTDIIQGTWFNVVVTRNGNIFSTYINGVLKGSITLITSSSGVNTTNSIRIGMANPSGEDFSWHADANVSCARMYNIALTASEVAQNFNALRGRYGI